MSEIKFRAFDYVTNQYIYVAYIDLVNHEVSGLPFDIQEGQEEIRIPTLATLEQFTGASDWYQGDIITNGQENYEIKWHADTCSWIATYDKCIEYFRLYEIKPFIGRIWRKIGTIHETPELLK